MIKQLFCSFFRTIGRIIAYLAFGALLGLILQKSDVFAADLSYSSSEYALYYYDYQAGVSDDGSYLFRYSDLTGWSGWNEPGTLLGSYNDTTGQYTVNGRYGFRWYFNNTNYIKKNNLYTITLQLNFGTTISRDYFYNNYVLFYARGNTTVSQDGNSIKYLDTDIRYSMVKDPDLNAVHITIKFIPLADLKFVRFDFINKGLNPIDDTTLTARLDTFAYGKTRYVSSSISFTEDTGALIENQTDTIIEQTNKLNQSIEDLKESLLENNDELNDIYTNDTENEDGTCGGILCNLKKVVRAVINLPGTLINAIIDALKSLFIPDDFDFINDFKDSIETKLGFVAEIPSTMIEFLFLLGTQEWEEMDSISFPEIEVFGYKFWNSQEIDLTEAINIFKPFKYITDVLCVIICINTMARWREKFTGGGN